jgi:hypothetical protein
LQKISLNVPQYDLRTLQFYFQLCSMSVHHFAAVRDAGLLSGGSLDREEEKMRFIVRMCRNYAAIGKESSITPSVIETALCANVGHIMAMVFRGGWNNSVLEYDSLGLLVALVISSPPDNVSVCTCAISSQVDVDNSIVSCNQHHSIFCTSFQERNIGILCYLIALVQIVADSSCEDSYCFSLDVPGDDASALNRLYKDVSVSIDRPNRASPKNLVARVRDKATRVLGRYVLFFKCLSNAKLGTPSSTDFEYFCSYLGLPTSFNELLSHPGIPDIIDSLLGGADTFRTLSSVSLPTGLARPLVSLPEEYATMVNEAAKFRCPNNVVGDCKFPALCLVCGTTVCALSTCCEERVKGLLLGGANSHMLRCGGAQAGGIFLCVRKCQVLLITEKQRGTSVDSIVFVL